MAETPERDIEKLLRDHAEARRAAAGEPALHPVNRRLLQDAVRRHWGGGGAGAGRTWLGGLWPRVALALAAVIVLGGVAVLFLPNPAKPVGELAKLKAENPTAQPAVAVNALEAAPEITAKPVAISDEMETRKQARALRVTESIARGDARQDRDAARPVPMVAAPAADTRLPAASGAGEFVFARREEKDAGKKTRLSSEAAGGPSGRVIGELSEALAYSTLATNRPAAQRFRNVSALADKSPAPVLANFALSQTGSIVTVVDADGSIYRGTGTPAEAVATFADSSGLTLAEPARVAGAPGQSASIASVAPAPSVRFQSVGSPAAAAPAQSQIAEAQAWAFTVEGTNRSLRQRVVFTGNLFPNAAPGGMPQNAMNLQNNVNAAPFINGRVTVGSQPAAELNAQAVAPP